MAYANINKATGFCSSGIYDGTGSSNAITGVGFQPDLVWIKDRGNDTANLLFDAVRGATKRLTSNNTDAEGTGSEQLTAFGSDGFTVGTNGDANASGENFVNWNWKAGTTSGLTGGTITPSSYSINTTSGFGIYKYTGTGSTGTIAHGLGVKPGLIIIKSTTATQQWSVYHKAMGATDALVMNTTAAKDTSSNFWNDTEPTSTLFTIGTNGQLNTSAETYIAYVWAPVNGFSRFTGYTGNGNSNGPTVYTGFKPSYLLIKRFDSGTLNWVTKDNARDTFNPVRNYIYPNLSNAGTNIGPPATAGGYEVDFYGTGFKIKTSDDKWNNDGGQFICIAFGQTIVGDNGVVATTYA